MTWQFNDECFTEIPKGYEAFVYLIENLTNGKKYIGKKFFYTRRKPPKTKKNENTKRRRVTKESDWKDYWSSSDFLKADVKELGEENFSRKILVICKTQGDASRVETEMLFENKVLYSDDWYNEAIGNNHRPPDHIVEDRIYSKKSENNA